MRRALELAARAAEGDEVPVGAVVVVDGRVVAEAHNEPRGRNDPTAHAEILALRRAGEALGHWWLNGATVYVTGYPRLFSPEHGPVLGASVHVPEKTVVSFKPGKVMKARVVRHHGARLVPQDEARGQGERLVIDTLTASAVSGGTLQGAGGLSLDAADGMPADTGALMQDIAHSYHRLAMASLVEPVSEGRFCNDSPQRPDQTQTLARQARSDRVQSLCQRPRTDADLLASV